MTAVTKEGRGTEQVHLLWVVAWQQGLGFSQTGCGAGSLHWGTEMRLAGGQVGNSRNPNLEGVALGRHVKTES